MAKPLQTLAAIGTLRFLLFAFNFLFWISGMVLLLSGAWIGLKLHRYFLLDSDGVGGGGGGDGGDLSSRVLPSVLCGLGVAVLAVASAACHCTINGTASRIYAYSTFLLLVLTLEVFLLGCAYQASSALDLAFHDGLSRGLEEYGRDPEATAAVDDIQTTLRCCGVSGFSDWQATAWGRGHGQDKLPHSCCGWTADAVCSVNSEHAELHTLGCYRLVSNFIVDNVLPIGLGVACASALHLLGLVLACCLARCVRRADQEHYQEIS